MVEYTVKEYIQSKDCLDARILAVENLIDAMLLTSIESVDNSGTMSYTLDDGQMKVTTQYRSMKEVTDGLVGLERILHGWINRRDGSITVLRGRLKF
jgi:hypothetical protein